MWTETTAQKTHTQNRQLINYSIRREKCIMSQLVTCSNNILELNEKLNMDWLYRVKDFAIYCH